MSVQYFSLPVLLREHTGGLLDLRTLHRLVERRRGSAADPVSLDDILQAIKKLEVRCTASSAALAPQRQQATIACWGQPRVPTWPRSLCRQEAAVCRIDTATLAAHVQ